MATKNLAVAVTVVGLAVTEKSGIAMLNVTVALWDRLLLVPVTTTGNDPEAVNVHESVEVPEPVTLVGVRAQAALLAVKFTTPVKPLTAVIVIVEVRAWLMLPETLVGRALIVKSVTV